MTPPENPPGGAPKDLDSGVAAPSEEIKDLGAAAGPIEDAVAELGQEGRKAGREKVADLGAEAGVSFEDAVAQIGVEGVSRADAVADEESPLLGADLDRVEAQSAQATGRLAGREDMLAASSADVRARYERAMVDDMAQSAYDESVMGGVYIGAFAGALIGLAVFKFSFGTHVLATAGTAIGLALVGGLIGYAIGIALGAGTKAAVSSERGSSALIAFGILLLAAPVATGLVAFAVSFAKWNLLLALGAWALIALGAFVYVFQDASYRGMGPAAAVGGGLLSAVCPVLIALHTARRPKGEMTECSHCERKHLARLTSCPHCGYQRRAGTPSKETLDLTNVK